MQEIACTGEKPTDTTASCPRCGADLTGIVTKGPSTHFADQCGHRVSAAYVRTFSFATAGGNNA